MMHSMFAESLSHRQRLAHVYCWRKADLRDSITSAQGTYVCRNEGRSTRSEAACKASVSPFASPHSSCVQRTGTEMWNEKLAIAGVIVAVGGLLRCVAVDWAWMTHPHYCNFVHRRALLSQP
jgi:hypothetical protein